MTTLKVADLFAGAGGMTTGCALAMKKLGMRGEFVAVNHWPIAVETHTVNHPEARHFCAPVESVDPRVAVPGGRLHLLMAAPECVHFSTARGGRPMNDQSRASAWHLLRWLELLRVDDVLIENVPEFLTWGPLGAHGRPLKGRKGETFKAFVRAVESLNYRVEWKILNAADYGEATTRRRLFIRARRGRKSIEWPEPTHGRKAGSTLLRSVRPWRAAREVIDWTVPGESIFRRKRPLAPATMRLPCKACGLPLGKGGKHYHQRCIPKTKRVATGSAGGRKTSLRRRAKKLGRIVQRAPRVLTRADLLVLLHEAEQTGYNRGLQAKRRQAKREAA